MKQVYHLVTKRDTHYVLGNNDGSGNIPKKIIARKNYYEVRFTHGEFVVRVYDVAYVFHGNWAANIKYYNIKKNPEAN